MRGETTQKSKSGEAEEEMHHEECAPALETSVEIAISRTPNAKLSGTLVIVELPKVDQLANLGVVFLDLDALRCAELIHLSFIFRYEDLLLLGQLLIKLQPWLRFRLLGHRQLHLQSVGSVNLDLQAPKFLRMFV
jgi:hypothetical protein